MVDPFEQPPVYKGDQVITHKDLDYLEQTFKLAEIRFFQEGDIRRAQECCIGHSLIAGLRVWVESGKKKEEERND